jgi:hypothetical protein
VGVVVTCHGGGWDDHDVVELRPDPAFGSSVLSGLGRDGGGLSDLVGSYPEQETDYWTALYPEALIG